MATPASTYAYSRSGCYAAVPNLKHRPIPEMDQYAVFTPDEPNVHFLNDAARMVLMFCDGRSGRELEEGYCAAVAPLVGRAAALAELRRTLEDLQRKGIVRETQHT